MMGWTAVHNALSPQALALFGILFFWQMPHFLAIAILYRRDYAAGGFKMLPVVDEDLTITGRQILLYTLALIPVTLLPALIGMAAPPISPPPSCWASVSYPSQSPAPPAASGLTLENCFSPRSSICRCS